MTRPIAFTWNGLSVEADVPPMKPLADVLREDLGFLGTKIGCGEGECGACTVRINGIAVMSCLTPVAQAEGCDVATVEGLADEAGALGDLQRAFLETGGAQCGICTPGMLVAAATYLDRGGDADEARIREAISGNLCRCTGYTAIVDAVAQVAAARDAAATEGRS